MSFDISKIFSGTFTNTSGGTSAGLLYTHTSTEFSKTVATTFLFTNTQSSSKTITLSKVPASTTEAQVHRKFASYTIPANKTIPVDNLRIVLESGDRIMAFQETASAINIEISGVFVT